MTTRQKAFQGSEFIARWLGKGVTGLVITAMMAPAWAWGPRTEVAVVTTAVHVLSQDRSMRLVPFRDYVRDGALMSAAERQSLYPNFELNPVGAIEREMYLLQAVRGNRVDPYFAYRLGGLGALVAQVTAPMRNANPTYRNQYYEDVDEAIQRAEMRSTDRRIVDPRAYFSLRQAEAQEQSATIEVDYRTGIGFNGLARNSLSLAASRSVSAVADVWYTILLTNVSQANVMPANMRDYVLGGLAFYIERDNLAEANETYNRARALNLLTPEVRKQIGDMYFAADQFERALEEYEAVLAAEPGRRDVMEKVALYHEQVGEEALARNRLEAARDAFAAAIQTNQLHPTAQRKLLQVEDMIAERQARLQRVQASIRQAQEAEAQAESEALRRNYAQAITHLREAEQLYGQVGSEFESEALVANLALKNLDLLMKEYKSDLISNAQNLSGTGFAEEARRISSQVPDIDEQALRSALDRQYRGAVQSLRQQLQDSLTRTP